MIPIAPCVTSLMHAGPGSRYDFESARNTRQGFRMGAFHPLEEESDQQSRHELDSFPTVTCFTVLHWDPKPNFGFFFLCIKEFCFRSVQF